MGGIQPYIAYIQDYVLMPDLRFGDPGERWRIVARVLQVRQAFMDKPRIYFGRGSVVVDDGGFVWNVIGWVGIGVGGGGRSVRGWSVVLMGVLFLVERADLMRKILVELRLCQKPIGLQKQGGGVPGCIFYVVE